METAGMIRGYIGVIYGLYWGLCSGSISVISGLYLGYVGAMLGFGLLSPLSWTIKWRRIWKIRSKLG